MQTCMMLTRLTLRQLTMALLSNHHPTKLIYKTPPEGHLLSTIKISPSTSYDVIQSSWRPVSQTKRPLSLERPVRLNEGPLKVARVRRGDIRMFCIFTELFPSKSGYHVLRLVNFDVIIGTIKREILNCRLTLNMSLCCFP